LFWSTRKTPELGFRFENVSIHPTAEIADDVEIGPFSFIGPNCRIGAGCRLHNNVSLVANTVLGRDNEIFPNAVLGAAPQDRKYDDEDSWVVVGNGNTVRECVTIHGGTAQGGHITRVGHRNLLMACCHVAHDCLVEDDTTIANGVLLGGHVHVGRRANLGGLAAVHHFVTIGEYAFVAGMARVHRDVPPFMLWQDDSVKTVNKVGLRRHGICETSLEALKTACKELYRDRNPWRETLRSLEERYPACREIAVLADAHRRMERGHQGRALQPYNVSL